MLYHLALLLPCTVCLFGTVWMLCKKESNTRAQNILMFCLLLSAVFFFCTANYIAGVPDYITYRRLDIMDCFIMPFIIPSMYLYFRALTDEREFTWKDYIWFLPSLVVGLGSFVLYMSMDETQAAGYITSVLINKLPGVEYGAAIYKLHYLFSMQLYTYIALFQIIGTAASAIVCLKRYHHRLREFHSAHDDNIYLDNIILCWFMSVIPFAFGIILVDEAFWQRHPAITTVYFIGYTTVYFGICYSGSQRKYTVENLAEDLYKADQEAVRNHYDSPQMEDTTEDIGTDTTDTLICGKYVKHLAVFNKLIEEEHIFLQNTLRADELAREVCTNRTYLSRMIKEEFGCTFSDYINRKRIEYAQKLMQEDPDIKLADLSTQSGFININTFGRTFKHFTELPPKEWLKKNVLRQ